MYFIGIDVGTSAAKLLIIDEKGNVINIVSKEYKIFFQKSNWSEQNPDDWWNAIKLGIKELVKDIDTQEIQGISFSGQMHGLVILDKDDDIIRPAILWNDQRTEKQCNFLNNKIGKSKIAGWTGNIALTGFTAPKLLWLKENERDNFSKIAKVMLPKDYIAYKLSGEFVTDVSDASGTLIFNVKNKRWSEEMLKILDIDENKLPSIYESYEVIGTIKKDIAEELGLPYNVKIVIGGGDQAVGAVGTGTVNSDSCSISLGTSGVIFASKDNFIVDKYNRLHSFCHANGKYHVMGVMLSAASSLKWWVENINSTNEYSKLLGEAENIDVKDNKVFFLPYLMGERTPHNDPYAKGCFVGMHLSNSRGNMTRAILEGVAFALRDSLDITRELGVEITKVRISGGGSKSSLWRQIIADVLNVQVDTINTTEGPAFGAAILAAVGCGIFNSVEDACNRIINVQNSVLPNKKNVLIYNERHKIFQKIYKDLKRDFNSLSNCI